jgi:capsular polysaccharide transport system permease protein
MQSWVVAVLATPRDCHPTGIPEPVMNDQSDPQHAASSRPPARRARLRPRHLVVLLSYVVMVVLPVLVSAWYLWARAADQYVSRAGFSVRQEETSSAVDLFGGVASLTGANTSDSDILYKFIQSQELVRRIDDALDLRALWAKGRAAGDFVFGYDAPGTIEDLVDYWPEMVTVYADSSTGLIDLEVRAFAPADAQAIARQIYDQSSRMINELSDIAREDATRYAREELDKAVERLKDSRAALTRFRNRTQIVDPSASIQTQMGLLSSLQSQLASALIDLDILRQTTRANDPRIVQTELRVEVIRKQIEDERNKLGLDGSTKDGNAAGGAQRDAVFADLVGRYEELAVDQKFAEESYVAALRAYDTAVAEARRQSRYLAAHIKPTLAEASTVPDRPWLLMLVVLFAFLIWAMAVLVAYALKDRR